MIRVQRLPNNVSDAAPEVTGEDLMTHETTVDNMTFAWGPGQVRNFTDDGLGVAHGAFDGDEDAVIESGLYSTNGESRA